ncbi:hypothetical protein QYE76_017423 [Lolium multiflorum]|uniref:RNase H type-1 domain-containing protein n=1 Tax=Lolium multiflorum TaxID=4521 RepID=A0AAD8QJM2_LOLMU|nr:hypothetical protein QYE76_017423 [Lolium multiflorum]
MADEQIKYEDLPPEHKKKYNELKAIFEADLIGAFEKTRSHGIKFKGAPELYQDKFKRVALVETEEDEDSAEDQEVAVAEWARGAAVSCKWVKQPGPAKGRMLDAETRYLEIEKLCLCLFFTCTKIQHILLKAEIIVICKSDVIKHMMSAPVLKGRLGKWMFALSEFDIRYQPAKAVKGQALADLIAERINTDVVAALSVRAWTMFFDGSVCEDGCGIGVLLVSPRGATYSFSIRISTPCTNNVAEYEAMCKGMELLLDAGAEAVEIFGDSKLVISQLTEEYKCESELLFPLWMQCRELMAQFRYINFHWIPRSQNTEANDLAQTASGYKDVADGADFQVQFMEPDDWRADIFN